MGIFIEVTVDGDRIAPALAAALVQLCPVDIFGVEDGRPTVRPEQEDECTLCELCLDAAPAGAITIHKLYRDEALISRKPEVTPQAP